MNAGSYRNVSFATAAGLDLLLHHGRKVMVRGDEVHEVLNRVTVLEQPRERCPFLPRRANNIFASLAETMWVLAGRNDIGWLQCYLPRAPDFSDDGITWRGGYGPRLRNWNGVDQLATIRELLLSEAVTRRAVITLFDPDRDFVPSKDIPCNNWLHWLVREGRLQLNIAVRSHDIMWGFSGVNSFEWSVLHEMMAFWVGAPVGPTTYFASSFHLYDRHLARADSIVAAFQGVTCYDYGLPPPPFQTRWQDFDNALDVWFKLESETRARPDRPIPCSLGDPLLDGGLQALRLYHGSTQGWCGARLRDELAALPATDLTAAAYEFFGRRYAEVLNSIPNRSIATFLEAYSAPKCTSVASSTSLDIVRLVKRLHRNKDAAYGDAWKRRGELTSILANVARKVDRLGQYAATGSRLTDETILDTAIDLFVYLTKYRLFLMDLVPETAVGPLPIHAPRPFSNHPSNFDALLDAMDVPTEVPALGDVLVRNIAEKFEALHAAASGQAQSPEERLATATSLAEFTLRLIVVVSRKHPATATAFEIAALRTPL